MAFDDRIEYNGDLGSVVSRVVESYSLGILNSFNLIEVGFEDFNLKIETSTGAYLAKIFSKKRSDHEVKRYVETIANVVEAGVCHPKPLSFSGKGIFYVDEASGLRLVLMEFIDGLTFYEMKRRPNKRELALIISEAVKIHLIDYRPNFVFDSWAIPNIKWMYRNTKDYLTDEGILLVEKALKLFESIPFQELPQCFVHGDFTKTNIICGNDGTMYIIDFAVSNMYPRIQELAVMAANLLFDEKNGVSSSLKDRCSVISAAYENAGGVLTQVEKSNLLGYATAASAMEYMGSVNERILGDDSDEVRYWEKLGLESLREALLT